jgi:hypothetical protein
MDPLSRLELEHERTLFMFYGYGTVEGGQGSGYFKLAHSLSEALADLEGNPGVADEGGYFVKDLFVAALEDDDSPTVHVELISLEQITQRVDSD